MISNVGVYLYSQSQINSLTSKNNLLEDRFVSLQSQFDSLNYTYEDYVANHRYSDSEYLTLEESYNHLAIEYEIEQCLRIGNALESYYDYLRQEIGPTGTKLWWQTPEESYWKMSVSFSANLALHDLALIYWPNIEDDYNNAVGEYSYETAAQKIIETVSLLNIENDDTSTEKISKVLDFISRHIHYETEINDLFLAPVETLGYKSGDCDDFSILAAALFESLEIESAIGFFVNESNQYHAMVLVHLNELTNYDYFSFTDLTGLGLEEGRWIIIEPQLIIESQTDNWITQWSLFVTAPLDVDN
jgi:hypothetical protein